MDFTPSIIETAPLDGGYIQLVEWRWPDMIDFVRSEPDLMLEMSLPPHATDASAEFPEIDPGNHCFMGTLFVRYPGVTIHGRGEGGQIRVLRCGFAADRARSILCDESVPPLAVLQGLLDLRNDSLRKMMGLALRELTMGENRSVDALNAIHNLIAVELRRVFERQTQGPPGGRLAGWQYRRIRARLLEGGPRPTAEELAILCGISIRHLARQFHALTGRTITDYVTNFWIERAKHMLATDEQSIKNIAFAVGFSHSNSFARAFRRATGIAPHSYRQRMTSPR